MSDNDDSNRGLLGGAPVSWVVIPLIGVIVFIATLTFLLLRRRRRNRALYGNPSFQNPHRGPGGGSGYYAGGSHIHHHGRGGVGSRWAPWGGTRSQDGLNELGEAPPPYIGKKSGGGTGATQDVELGMPPDYHVAGPAPAVTTESRRH